VLPREIRGRILEPGEPVFINDGGDGFRFGNAEDAEAESVFVSFPVVRTQRRNPAATPTKANGIGGGGADHPASSIAAPARGAVEGAAATRPGATATASARGGGAASVRSGTSGPISPRNRVNPRIGATMRRGGNARSSRTLIRPLPSLPPSRPSLRPTPRSAVEARHLVGGPAAHRSVVMACSRCTHA